MASKQAEPILDWLAQLAIGFIVPMAALIAGQQLAAYLQSYYEVHGSAVIATPSPSPSPYGSRLPVDTEQVSPSVSDEPSAEPHVLAAQASSLELGQVARPGDLSSSRILRPRWHTHAEVALVAVYLSATALLIAAPVPAGWEEITLATVMGSLGAYLRYRLAVFNAPPKPRDPDASGPRGGCCGSFEWFRIPRGTLAVNVFGTWLLAVFSCLALTTSPPPGVRSLLFGLSVGFCGCLTTMSTFVLELRRLPRVRDAYAYGALSFAAAQAGWLLIAGLWQNHGYAF